MSLLSKFVSLHPYFKVHPGKLDAIKAILPQFTARTATEKAMLLYEFSWNGDELFCREGYTDAEGVLAHLDNVGSCSRNCSPWAISHESKYMARQRSWRS